MVCFTFSHLSLIFGGAHNCQEFCTNGSCCETSLDRYMCCGYVNGVCCPNGLTCCPQGSWCTSDGFSCLYPNGNLTARKLLKSNQIIPDPIKSNDVYDYVICSDRISVCSENTTCCSMGNNTWGCCNIPNAVCCDDGLHCCPQHMTCNRIQGSCDPVNDTSLIPNTGLTIPFMSRLTNPRTSASALDPAASTDSQRMSYDGVQCSDSLECPLHTTCCRNTTGQFACCPMPDALCCPDGNHCCPKGTMCGSETDQCIPETDVYKISSSLSYIRNIQSHQLCPDGQAVCLDDQTCCKLQDKSWGCCPLPNAVCCLDGEHCCPSGYRCDLSSHQCMKNTASPSKATEVVCPDNSFRCNSKSTCCSLPNQEWACCPFENAVCCSDMLHCCPENSTCDVEHEQCLRTIPASQQPLNSIESDNSQRTCSSGLFFCPNGSCCKNIFGLDACCPHPEAVCCSNGHCCPKGTICDNFTKSCLPSDSLSIPWVRKVSAQKSLAVSMSSTDNQCPDEKSTCPDRQACCPLIDGSFGCCPLANGVCCADNRHCCPSGSICTGDGTCIRELAQSSSKRVIKAESMVSVTAHSPHSSDSNVVAQFCGLCADEWLCCPDSTGRPNHKCCPAPGRVCCPDGEHCCPMGTTCVAGGMCARIDHNLEISSSVFLVPSKTPNQPKAQFLDHSLIISDRWPAPMANRALVNVLFLIPSYYRSHSGEHTVCPDRERYCKLDQKCCVSIQHAYVCVPIDATCCNPALDTWCHSGSYCSDGHSCQAHPD